MEKILSISTDLFKGDEKLWTNYDGFKIETTEQVIKIGIQAGQSCCESYGCIITNDDIKDFIGSDLIDVSISDTVLNNKKIEELEVYEGGVMFVNIETSKGLLQFAAYNAHNGYYGHDAVLISRQLYHEETL